MKSELRDLREQQGLTQEQLSEKAGVCRKTIHNFEHGRGNNITTLTKLAKALNVDIKELV